MATMQTHLVCRVGLAVAGFVGLEKAERLGVAAVVVLVVVERAGEIVTGRKDCD